MKYLTPDQTRFLCEVVLNILHGNIIITNHYKRKLRHYKPVLLKIVSKSISNERRKQIYAKYYKVIKYIAAASVDTLIEASV